MPILPDSNVSPAQDYLTEFEHPATPFATFWARFGALLIDGFVLAPVTALSFYNLISLKNLLLQIMVSLVSLLYKPFMEFKYGATLGKMALGIKVVSREFQPPGLDNIICRNIFQLIIAGSSILVTLLVFFSPDFRNADTFMAYSRLQNSMGNGRINMYASFSIYLADTIFLWSDSKNRALHDRIGKTLVVIKK